MTEPALILTAAAAAVVDRERRTIRGRIVAFGKVGNTSAGPTRFHPGSLRWTDPKRVKLVREHDRTTPLAHAVELVESAEGIDAVFRVPEGPDGDRALHEAAEGLRDGLSVGVEPIDASPVDGVLDVRAAALREVSQVAVPAFDDCRVTSVAAALGDGAPGDQPDPETPASTPPAETPEQEGSTVPETDPATPPPVVEASTSTAPPPSTPPGPSGPREVDLQQFTTLVAQAATGLLSAADAPLLRAALTDVVPANTGGAPPAGSTENAFFRPAYLSELWHEAGAVQRPLIDAFGGPSPLPRAMEIRAFRWTQRPEVDDYAGNKAEVPSGPVSMAPLRVAVERTAGAHDIDRAYIDLGSPDFLAAYFAAMTEDYKRKTEAKFAAHLLANVTAVADENAAGAGQVATLLDGILAGAIALLANGHTPEVVAVGPGLLRDLFGITTQEAAAYLQGSISLRNVTDQSIGGLQFTVSPSITGRNMLVGARAATKFWEATPPIRVQALDVANGGVDAGVFGYHAQAVVNETAIRRVEVAP